MNAKEAKDVAITLMKAAPRKYTIEYIGEWNDLMLYLEAEARK